jgi:hypothetical protein
VLSDGKIIPEGAPDLLSDDAIELLEETGDISLNQNKDAPKAEALFVEQSNGATESTLESKPKKSGKLILEEERAVGRVPKKLVWQYIKYFGGPAIIVGLAFFSMMNQLTRYVLSMLAYNNYLADKKIGWRTHSMLVFGLVRDVLMIIILHCLILLLDQYQKGGEVNVTWWLVSNF